MCEFSREKSVIHFHRQRDRNVVEQNRSTGSDLLGRVLLQKWGLRYKIFIYDVILIKLISNIIGTKPIMCIKTNKIHSAKPRWWRKMSLVVIGYEQDSSLQFCQTRSSAKEIELFSILPKRSELSPSYSPMCR